MDEGVKMISSASKAFELRKGNSSMGENEILAHISRMAYSERDQKVKIGMMAAASKALSIIDRNPNYNERQVLREVMQELPGILALANEDFKFNSRE